MIPARSSFLCAFVLLAGPALAQETPAPDGKARGKALRESLAARDAALEGKLHLGVYINSTKNIGAVAIEIGPGADGGAYTVRTRVRLKFGPNSFEESEEVSLGTDLGALALRREKNEQEGEGRQSEKLDARLADGKWSATRSLDGGAEQTGSVEGEPSYWGMASAVLLMRKLDLSQPGEYELQGVEWERGAEAPTARRVAVSVPAERKKVQHRGSEVEATAVRLVREGEDDMVLLVGEGGKVLRIEHGETPLALIAGSEEESTRDIAAVGPPVDEAAMACVITYLKVMAKSEPPEALDGVVDWKAVWEDLSNESPEIKALTPEAFGQLMKGQLAGAAQVTQEQIDALITMLAPEPSAAGDEVTVRLPGDARSFVIKKQEAGWRIVRFPH
jgi:hypothetical protein